MQQLCDPGQNVNLPVAGVKRPLLKDDGRRVKPTTATKLPVGLVRADRKQDYRCNSDNLYSRQTSEAYLVDLIESTLYSKFSTNKEATPNLLQKQAHKTRTQDFFVSNFKIQDR